MPNNKAVKSSQAVIDESKSLEYVIGTEHSDLTVLRVKRKGKYGPKDSYVALHAGKVCGLPTTLALNDTMAQIWQDFDSAETETVHHNPKEMARLHLSMFTPQD